jgi:PAT family beta-lactamase induction signal transducer AmpG
MKRLQESISPLEKFSLFACLYFSQGLPYGFFTQAMPVYLREAKMSLAAIGGASLLTLPWALKFLWAPLADRYGIPQLGLRRSWILTLQLISIFSLVCVSFFNPAESLVVVLAAFLACNFLAATQDIATDGLAVDLLNQNERGWANGIQVGGYRVGMIAGGSVMLTLLSHLGWQFAMLSMAVTMSLMTLPALFFREREVLGEIAARVDSHLVRHPVRDLKAFLGQSGIFSWLTILLVFKFCHQSASAMMKPWLVDNGYKLSEIGAIMGLFGSGAGLMGAVLGGFVASRFDRIKSLATLSGIQALATATYLVPVFSSPAAWKVAIATTLDNGVSGMATVTLFAAMMDRCRKGHAASDYTIQASIVVISQTSASALSGISAEAMGYQQHFALISVLGLLVWGTIRWLTKVKQPLLKVLSLVPAALVLFSIDPNLAKAQTEVGVGFGPLLPSRIPYVREIQNSWGLRAGTSTSKGFFELDWAHGRGDDIIYNSFSFDYRMSLDSQTSEAKESVMAKSDFPVHFILGLHLDYFKGSEQDFRSAGGWHYGGGIQIPVGGPTSPFRFRSDFRHRFSPGSSLLVLIGFSLEMGGDNS